MAEQTKKKFKFRFPLWAKTLLVLLFSVSLISIVGINFFSSTIRSITRNFYIDQSVETASTLAIFLDLNNVKAVKNKTDEIYQSIPEKDKVENALKELNLDENVRGEKLSIEQFGKLSEILK